MTLEELQEITEKKLKINDTELDVEALKTPQLHNEFLKHYNKFRLLLNRTESELAIIKLHKWEYYTGKIDQETLDKKGWEPFQHNILKQDIPIFMNSDEDLCKRKEVITYIKSIVEYLEEVVKEITFRHTKIKNAIEWRRFLSGA